MPTLLQINVTANWGSTGKIAEGIGEVVMNHGWESYIAYGRYMNPSKSKLIKVGSQMDVYAHFVRSYFFDQEGLGSIQATRRFINHVSEIKPDIVHLHNIHDHWLNYPILFDYLSKIEVPVVWTMHDCWGFTGSCAYFDAYGCTKWKVQCEKCPERQGRLDCSKRNFERKKRLFEKIAHKTVLIPVSNWLSDFTKKSFLQIADIQVIHNGINIDIFKPSSYSSKEESNILLGVALPWSPRKGLNDMLKLRADERLKEYKIVLIGLSKKQIRELPEGMIGIEKTTDANELAKYYSQASVFINPTYSDNFPTTNIEALACGTPVITYKTGGSPEAISVDTGFVAKQGDIEGVISAIKTIERNGKAFYSENCRKRAEECFNKDKQFMKYIELYNKLLSNE